MWFRSPMRAIVARGSAAFVVAALVAPGPLGAQSLAEFYDKAKQEGALVLYGGGPTSLYEVPARAFEQKYPGIKIVDTQNGKQERSTALTVTENMIQSHPDLNGLFSVNDGGAMGALAAIEASGKKISLVSVDGLGEAVNVILKGSMFKATVAQYPRDQVRIALGIALAKHWGANVPAEIPVSVKLLTAENAKGFSW